MVGIVRASGGKAKRTLVYTNNDASQGAITATFDTTLYNFFEVYILERASATELMPRILLNGEQYYGSVSAQIIAADHNIARRVTLSATSIFFGDAMYNSSANRSLCLIREVYGCNVDKKVYDMMTQES